MAGTVSAQATAMAGTMATAVAIEVPPEGMEDDYLPPLKPWLCAGWENQLPPWEAQDSLHGHLVEVHSLSGIIQAGWAQNPRMLLSAGTDAAGVECVDGAQQNGKRGRAAEVNESMYSVETFDGEMLYVPSKNLTEYVSPKPEDGGFDFHWPAWEADSLEWFSGRVAAALDTRGYTVIQTFHARELRKAMIDLAQQTEWSRLDPLYEEGFVGQDPASVAWVSQNSSDEALRCSSLCVADMCSLLSTWSQDGLGFASEQKPAWLMLRQGLLGRSTIRSTGDETTEDAASPSSHIGVAHYLDFVQRRKICIMCVVESKGGGTIELSPKAADSHLENIMLPVMPNRIILFRHDLLSYRFSPSRADLVLQGWLMQQPPTIQVQHVTGDETAVLAAIGASARYLPHSNEAHIMAIGSTLPGDGQGFASAGVMYFRGTDTVVQVPSSRWEHDLYYSPELTAGLTTCKHTAFMSEEMITTFDHRFFGLSYEDACLLTKSSYKVLEVGFETLYSAGFTKETLRNAPIMTVHGSSARSEERCDREKSVGSRFTGHYSLSNLLTYFLGLAGPSSTVDTACSSSLVGAHAVHQQLMMRRDGKAHRLIDPSSVTSGLSMGSNVICDPMSYVGMSQVSMLSASGRSFTFNATADGFIRGESISCVYITLQDDTESACNQIAALSGCASNQDGRSASLTAPSGPSQGNVIRESLENAKRSLAEISFNELHGTGTQLGDPIEIACLKTMTVYGSDNPEPLIMSAGKSVTGNCEYAGGAVGLVRAMMACYHATAPANCHLRQLNMHIDLETTAAIYPSEATDIGHEGICAGVSSFGFGGTNARADLWAECRKASRAAAPVGSLPGGQGAIAHVAKQPNQNKIINFEHLDIILLTCPRCLGQMCWRCKEAYNKETQSTEQHCCTLIRHESASYDVCSECYRGSYMTGDAMPVASVELGDPGRQVFVVGSWTNWQEYEEMTQKVDADGDAHYELTVRLDENRQANFRIVLDQDPDLSIYPTGSNANQQTRIIGPSGHPKDRSWLIDGIPDGAAPGTAYKVRFFWTTEGKSIEWQLVGPVSKRANAANRGFKYSILGSWSGWGLAEMRRESKNGVVMWVTSARIGLSGEEEFWIVQGRDRKDAIFPEGGVKTTDMKVPISAVAPNPAGYSWLISGTHGETVTIRLRVSETSMVLTTSAKSQGTRSWKSKATPKALEAGSRK